MNGVDGGPFHAGELRAQMLAGAGSAGGAIRDAMPEQHRDFFAGLRYLALATLDPDGWPVATMLAGPAGFIASPDARRLELAVPVERADPALHALHKGSPVGLLGIDFSNRRRNRANGLAAAVHAGGLHIDVRESFGNCPKYIHVREVESGSANASAPAEHFIGLDEGARALLAVAETFFVASSAGNTGGAGGVDISHRGGPAGFVQVNGATLTIPDYSGNRYFNTLGNLLLEPRSALLFIDFASGDLLHLQGRAEILWQQPQGRSLPAAERSWHFHVQGGWRRRAALPLRWNRRNPA
ncbi:MAG: pyridoxamine 5'-phosphate oxidase family protein [Pseudomonadota bacterium]